MTTLDRARLAVAEINAREIDRATRYAALAEKDREGCRAECDAEDAEIISRAIQEWLIAHDADS